MGDLSPRALGSTGVRVSPLGFGCGDGAGLLTDPDPRRHRVIIEHAFASGVTFFDLASGYAGGAAERRFARAVTAIDREPVVLAKIALGPAALADIAGQVLAAATQTLRRLRLKRVAVIGLHNHVGVRTEASAPLAPGPRIGLAHLLGPGGVAEALNGLKERGLAEAVAFTTFGGDHPAVLEVLRSGAFDVVDVEHHMYADDQRHRQAHEVLGLAAAADTGVIAIRPLGGGSRATRSPNARTELVDRLVAAGQVATVAEGALRFAAAPGVASVVLGISRRRHVDDAVEALSRGALPARADYGCR